ncbi:arylsulfotransferase family protein [Pelagibius sp. Alg239-R121]|uniref:arylsulfotransferase family protein n=1 Tax=Pelagibius sp. Alg239-R121 TaxID=2993448 RepID=UPI0024A68F40|nr:arylsulfotransferase family protein [Pelagibius sp. Alg239-R121]
MNFAQRAGFFYLFALIFVGWGVAIGKYEVFPYTVLKGIQDFLVGDPAEEADLFSKLKNDLDIAPERQLHKIVPNPNREFTELRVDGLKARRDSPRIFLGDAQAPGYRILFGAFDFDQHFWGALLLDDQGKLVHRWLLSTEELPTNEAQDLLKNLYGVAVLPDGSVIFSMQEKAGGIAKVDVCGNHLWALEGKYHHTVSLTDENSFWTFGGSQKAFDHHLHLVDVEDGKILKTIDMKEVRLKNPNIHIFDLQVEKGVPDAVHGNDIEALTAAMLPAFPGFEKGDLLLSFRTTNLVFVLDPDSLKIKWWRVGPWDRQHDPDWNPDGTISVFSNNERGVGKYSNIISINPQTYEFQTLVDGSNYDFRSSFNGMHQITDRGSVLISSGLQGRLFEVDRNGEVIFDFVNSYSWEHQRALRVSEARYLERDFFSFEGFPTCEN